MIFKTLRNMNYTAELGDVIDLIIVSGKGKCKIIFENETSELIVLDKKLDNEEYLSYDWPTVLHRGDKITIKKGKKVSVVIRIVNFCPRVLTTGRTKSDSVKT